jgi:hypothetical protein
MRVIIYLCRITYSTNPTKKSQGFGRDIPYTRATFEKLVDKFKLPKQFLELVSNSSSGVFAQFKNSSGVGMSLLDTQSRPMVHPISSTPFGLCQANPSSPLGFVLQNPDSARTQAMKLTLILHHDSTLNLTTGLIHYWDWYSGLFNMFLSLLRSDPGRCLNPYFFPITFLKAHNWWSESFRSHLNDLMTSFADLDDYDFGSDSNSNSGSSDGLAGRPGGASERDIRNIMNEISRFIHNLPTENSHAVFQGNMCEMLLKELEGKKGQEELYEVLGLLRFQIAGHKEAIGNLRTRIEARNSMVSG